MNELTEVKLEEVSLVAEGANPEAKILLYKSKDKPDDKPEADSVVVELAELRELAKSLRESVEKSQTAQEVEALRKFEVLGTPAEKLQRILKTAKAHSQELYDSTLATLEESLAVLNKSKLFEEVGTSRAGGNSDAQEIAKSIQKNNPALSWREALDKAYVQQMEAAK